MVSVHTSRLKLWLRQVVGPGRLAETLAGSLLRLRKLIQMKFVIFEAESPPELLDHVLDNRRPRQAGLLPKWRYAFAGGGDPLIAQLFLTNPEHFEHQGQVHIVGHGGVM